MDGLDGGLGRVIGGDALDGKAQNLTRLLVRLGAGTLLGLTDDCGAFVRDLVLKGVEELLLSLFGGHAGNVLQTSIHLQHGLLQVAFATLDLALHGGKLVLARIEALDAAVKRLLALVKAILSGANFAHTLLVLSLGLLLHLEDLVLGLDDRLAAHRLSLTLGVGHELTSLLSGALGGRICKVAGDYETDGNADDDAYNADDDRKQIWHRPPLSFI